MNINYKFRRALRARLFVHPSSTFSGPSSAVTAGYEVFYQVDGGTTLSGGNTSNTELTLTGLTLGTHSFFVVGYGAEGAPVLPSAHSNTASVMIGEINDIAIDKIIA